MVCFKCNRISNGIFHGVLIFHLKSQCWEQKVIIIPRFLNGVLALPYACRNCEKTAKLVSTFHHILPTHAGERVWLTTLWGSGRYCGISLSLLMRWPLRELGAPVGPWDWNRAGWRIHGEMDVCLWNLGIWMSGTWCLLPAWWVWNAGGWSEQTVIPKWVKRATVSMSALPEFLGVRTCVFQELQWKIAGLEPGALLVGWRDPSNKLLYDIFLSRSWAVCKKLLGEVGECICFGGGFSAG